MASTPGNTLLDVSVGKGGDIYKWINAKLSFVVGIDINRDNYTDLLALGRLETAGISHMYINDGAGKLLKSSSIAFMFGNNLIG